MAGVTELVPDFSALAGFNWSVFLGVMTYFLLTIFLVIMLIYVFFLHNVQVDVLLRRGGGVVFKSTAARIIDKNGTKSIKFLFSNKLIPHPDNKFFYANRGFFRRSRITYIEDGSGDYHPVNVNQLAEEFEPVPQDTKFWLTNSLKENNSRFGEQSVLMQFLPQIINAGIFMMFFVLALVLLYQIKDISSALGNVAGALSSIGAPVI